MTSIGQGKQFKQHGIGSNEMVRFTWQAISLWTIMKSFKCCSRCKISVPSNVRVDKKNHSLAG